MTRENEPYPAWLYLIVIVIRRHMMVKIGGDSAVRTVGAQQG